MNEALARLHRRIMSALGRGRVAYVDDTGAVQTVQVQTSAAEVLESIPRAQEYGFTSVPPAGTDAVTVHLHGDRSQGIVIATNSQQYRLRGLENGDAALYDMRGQSVVLTKDGIVVTGFGKNIAITGCPKLTIDGDIEATGDVKAGSISLKTHTHGGVEPGGGNTGAPS